MKYNIKNSPFYLYYRRNLLWFSVFFLIWVGFLIWDIIDPSLNDKIAFLQIVLIVIVPLTGLASFYYLYRFLVVRFTKYEVQETLGIGAMKNKVAGLYGIACYIRVNGKEEKCLTPAIFSDRGRNMLYKDYLNTEIYVGYIRQWNKVIILGLKVK